MILNLTTSPTSKEHDLFMQLLNSSDYILVSDSAAGLCLQHNTTPAKALIRSVELKKLGGQCHNDWREIDDQEWFKLVASSSKTVVW